MMLFIIVAKGLILWMKPDTKEGVKQVRRPQNKIDGGGGNKEHSGKHHCIHSQATPRQLPWKPNGTRVGSSARAIGPLEISSVSITMKSLRLRD